MIERVFAGIVLAVCALMLVRLMLDDRRRWRFDSFFRRSWQRIVETGAVVRHWRKARRNATHARQMADEAIQRARGRRPVEKEGNVYTPKSFRKPPRDKMH